MKFVAPGKSRELFDKDAIMIGPHFREDGGFRFVPKLKPGTTEFSVDPWVKGLKLTFSSQSCHFSRDLGLQL